MRVSGLKSNATYSCDPTIRVVIRASGEEMPGRRHRAKILAFLAYSVLTLLVGELIMWVGFHADDQEYIVDEELLRVFRPSQRILLPHVAGQGNAGSRMRFAIPANY